MSPNDEQTPTSLNKLSIGFNQSKEYNLNCRQFRQKECGQKTKFKICLQIYENRVEQQIL